MIGDVLTSSILFEALRLKYPKAQLYYLINEHTYPVVQNNPFIDNFILFTPEAEKSKIKLFNLAKTIRKEKFDIVIDVYCKLSSNFITALSGAGIKISKYKWYSSFIYTNTYKEENIAKTKAGLAIENRLKLLEPLLQINQQFIKPKIYLTEQEHENSRQFLITNKIELNKRIFMINVLGSDSFKTYPLPYMAKIIDKIVEETQAQILFNYIPNQEPDALKVFNLCNVYTQKHVYFNIFGNNLREFLAITTHCNALIGNEGGAVNMAKALNIATFTIFSPWILKEAWNMFEDGKNHMSVHLKDENTELYEGKLLKDIKKKASEFYNLFLPDLIIPKLRAFLKTN